LVQLAKDHPRKLEEGEKTLNLVKEEEKKQNLPWAGICEKQANEKARNQQSSELAGQKFLEAKSRTRQNIAECKRQKRSEESEQKAQGYRDLFEQLGRVEALQEAERREREERHRRACEGK
jgi:hypothetical protein